MFLAKMLSVILISALFFIHQSSACYVCDSSQHNDCELNKDTHCFILTGTEKPMPTTTNPSGTTAPTTNSTTSQTTSSTTSTTTTTAPTTNSTTTTSPTTNPTTSSTTNSTTSTTPTTTTDSTTSSNTTTTPTTTSTTSSTTNSDASSSKSPSPKAQRSETTTSEEPLSNTRVKRSPLKAGEQFRAAEGLITIRGSLYDKSCDDIKKDHEKKLTDMECTDCDNGNKCNSSGNINAGILSLLVAIFVYNSYNN